MPLIIPIIAGPTAVGKTRLSIDLAQRLNAEIVSFDSRQIYRGLDVGTAKPSEADLEAVPHHFIDERDPDETISAGEYAREAWRRIEEIAGRGKMALAAGGSTLYLQALTEGLADIPPVPPGVRAAVEQRLEAEGPGALLEELQEIDADSAATMDATKTQRLVRALEVYHATGRPLSVYHRNHVQPPFQFRVFVLERDRDELYDRINRRVDQMLDEGLVDEVRGLLAAGVSPDINAMQTIGYREPVQYLKAAIDYQEMGRLIKRNTRRYAKRQLTWFRAREGYTWIPADTSAEGVAAALTEGAAGAASAR